MIPENNPQSLDELRSFQPDGEQLRDEIWEVVVGVGARWTTDEATDLLVALIQPSIDKAKREERKTFREFLKGVKLPKYVKSSVSDGEKFTDCYMPASPENTRKTILDALPEEGE